MQSLTARVLVMKNLEISYLMDFYGNLLSDKQRTIMQLYYQEDLSLFEIAQQTLTTRQGVRDLLNRTADELARYEQALALNSKRKQLAGLEERLRLLAGSLPADTARPLEELGEEMLSLFGL